MFIEVPCTTLDSILKRGIDKANVLNIIKICNALDIDIDALANGRIQSKIKLVKTPLTAYEQAHIQKYRKLDASGRDMVDTVLGKEVERLKRGRIRRAARNTSPSQSLLAARCRMMRF